MPCPSIVAAMSLYLRVRRTEESKASESGIRARDDDRCPTTAHGSPVLAGNEIGGLKEDGRPVVPGKLLPGLLGLGGRLNSLGDELGRGSVVLAERGALVVVREGLLEDVAGFDLNKRASGREGGGERGKM